MAGKHSRTRPPRPPRRTIEMVELRAGTTHLLTPDALAAGFEAKGHYVALCGAELLPAPLTDPGRDYCRRCTSAIPAQRSRTSR